MKKISNFFSTFIGLAPLFLILVLWELFSNKPSPHFPAPSYWLQSIQQIFLNGILINSIWNTIWTFLIGLLIAASSGFILGILIGINSSIKEWTAYILEAFRSLPPPVIIPIAVLLMGYSPSMKIAVISIATLWPILLNVIAGVSQISLGVIDASKSLKLSRKDMLLKIVFPSVLPFYILGIRVAIPLAIVITLLIEMLTGMIGLGGIMIAGQRNYNSAQVFGVLVIVGLLGLGINLFSQLIERQLLKNWPPKKSL
jgi:ABC-type nitrate/sulfonate/bicarbonate transport system permease component